MAHLLYIVVLAYILLTCGPAVSQDTDKQIFIRKKASSDAARGDLEALATALKKMKAMGCEDPLSWYYQGAIHSVPDKVKDNKLCPSYQSTADLKWAWNTCTHVEGSEIHFLVWHRLYIAHFEKIVRKLSGKVDFSLPYWNYMDPTDRKLPSFFSKQDSPLHASERLPSLNDGRAIDQSMDDNLSTQILMKNRVYSVFSTNIDSAPHGAMHSYIGGARARKHMWNSIYQNQDNYGLMAQVESAGFDPVFWLHHSTIDFIWQSWEQSANGVRPRLEELKSVPWPYNFLNEDGKQVSYSIEEAYAAAFSPDYKYDDLKPPIRLASASDHESLVQRGIPQKKQLLWKKDISVTTSKHSITLMPDKLPSNKRRELFLTDRPLTMVIEIDVSFKQEPTDSFSVYISDRNGNKKLAGVMTFFGASRHTSVEKKRHQKKMSKIFSYDVDADLPSNGDYKILIESQTKNGDRITVESMSLYRY